jgi:hypothetical protein
MKAGKGDLNWSLVVTRNGQRQESYPLTGDVVRIGRNQENQICLPDNSVSRLHAEIRMGPQGPVIRDPGSRNGVKVNGVPRLEAVLHDGDQIQIGIHTFQASTLPSPVSPPVSKQPRRADPSVDTVRHQSPLAQPRAERHLQTLYHLCFWMADGVAEDVLLNRGLRLLLEGFSCSEVQLYSADGVRQAVEVDGDGKSAVLLESFLAKRLGEYSEATCVPGKELFGHQKNIHNFNFLVGALRTSPSVADPAPWLLLVRDAQWEDFTAEDRKLLQAVCQLWVRSQDRTRAIRQLQEENVRLKAAIQSPLLGESKQMEQLRERALKFASTLSSVLILGEPGTGKELVAQLIHENSKVSSGPFIRVNCAAISTGLIDSELFGHVKGAFTGADKRRDGKFKAAEGGTLFLDEIGELPLEVQAKLLRVLENREFHPVGSDKLETTNARIVAATNKDLNQLVAEGRFRTDLFDRLAVLKLFTPPLRDHPQDIPAIANHFLELAIRENGLGDLGFATSALESLQRHRWKGNVRELRSVVQRCAAFASGLVIDDGVVGEAIRG